MSIHDYCNAVVSFYKDEPFRKLQAQLSREKTLPGIRDLLKTACETWLRKEHILPLFYDIPKVIKWDTDDTLTRLAGAAIMMLEFGMFVPPVFQQKPTPYRPIPGDDTMCAEMCMYLYRVWCSAYRASQHRVGMTDVTLGVAALPASYRNPISMTSDKSIEVLLTNEDDVMQFIEYFEWRVASFVKDNLQNI